MPSSPTASTSPVERAADQFAAELARWRVERGLTKKQLAAQMGFDPSYVSHVEGRRHRPTEDFARRAEAVLGAGGAIWQRFQEYDDLRHARAAGQAPLRDPPVPGAVDAARHRADRRAGGRLAHVPGRGVPVRDPALALQRRHRAGHPLPRADRGRPVPATTRPRSNRHHRDHPLTFAELDLQAYCGDPPTRRADAVAPQARPGRVQGGLAALRERRRPVPALPRRADHHRVRLHGRRGEVGAVVPARRTAADPPAHRPPGLPARASTRRCGASRRRCRGGGRRCVRRSCARSTPTGCGSSGRPTRRR